jgi:SSS family solute:Na+ symporter
MLVKNVLPVVLVGFFAAVLFGAILSSFNSALNSSVTLFGLGIYKEYVNKNADEQTIVKAGKKFGTVLAVVSMCIAPLLIYASDGLFAYLQEVNGIYSIPILTIIVVGYMTKYVPAIAAKIGIISGSVLYIISQFIIKPYVIGKDDYPHFLHVMAILFALNVIIMLLIGKFYPRDSEYNQKYTEQVDIQPWKYGVGVGIVICVIVISSFLYFS